VLRLGPADFGVAPPDSAGVGREQGRETFAALRRQFVVPDPGEVDPPVVVE
jgi:hypothetical protein